MPTKQGQKSAALHLVQIFCKERAGKIRCQWSSIFNFSSCVPPIQLEGDPLVDFNLIQVFTWFKDEFVNITYLCNIKQMDILASPTFQLFCGLLLSWCLMLDLLTNSGPLFVGWPLGLWCPPDTRIVNYLDHQSPYCQLWRQNQLLEISFSNRLKAGFYIGIISYSALMASS